MDWQSFTVVTSGLALIFFYCFCRFDTPPPVRPDVSHDGAKMLSILREWFQLHDPPASLILPPSRANTTGFKFWLYRMVYTFFGMGIYLLVWKVPGLQFAISELWKLTGETVPALDLTNGVLLALSLIILTRLPPFRGADATLRGALYERASIPAQQLSFQSLLRSAPYLPDPKMVEIIRDILISDGFDGDDISYDAKTTTRSLWLKINLLIQQLERWAQEDQYKTAFALLREPGSEKRSIDRMREARDALAADARVCLSALRNHPNAETTLQREDLFRQDCKVLLDELYRLITRIMLRSRFSYYDAIVAVKYAGFDLQTNATPLPNKNDLVALVLMLFLLITVPLTYVLGLFRASMITVIYVLATLTPIYLAAEWPVLLQRENRRMPPLAFPMLSALVAGFIGFLFSVGIGSIASFSLSKGIEHWWLVSYPWTILVCGLTGTLSILMMFGRYPEITQLKGIKRCSQWGCLTDALIMGGITFGLMVLIVFPELVRVMPDKYSWEHPYFVFLRTVITAFFIGLVVPTWYRGNRELIQKKVE